MALPFTGAQASIREVCQPGRRMRGIVRAVVEAGGALGVEVRPHEYADGTRTAADAAPLLRVTGGTVCDLALR